ncbi:BofC C-terminal domain-containing protein [Paenibacillus marinisediminis]
MAHDDHTNSQATSRLNQLKKKMKRWKRPLWSLALIIITLTAFGYGLKVTKDARELANSENNRIQRAQETFMLLQEGDKVPSEATQQVMKQLNQRNSKYTVVHRIQYVCGKRDAVMGKKTSTDIIQLVLEHPDWEASIDAAGRVVLEEHRNELSETCKDNAFIGMDNEGNLTLYDGEPESDNVIRTFFQLDIESMESSLPPQVLKQLRAGIRISDIEEYNSVISTFSDYAVEATSEVLKPSQMP